MNQKWMALALFGSFIFSGCDRQEPVANPAGETTATENKVPGVARLVAVYRTPVLEELQTGEALTVACDAEVADLTEWLALLEQFDGSPTVESFLEPFNGVMVSAYNMSSTAGTLSAVSTNASVSSAGDDCGQALARVLSEYTVSRPVYEQISQIDLAAADADARRYVEKLLLNFRLSGVEKDEEQRTRITQLNEEITQVGQEFDNNIRDSVLYLDLDSVDQLDGLPQDYIDAHPPGEDGKIRISTQYPDLFPFMSYARNDELR
ncbi:MAG: hypothetical protein ACREO9_09345, partial [Lysobacterales bacterium]